MDVGRRLRSVESNDKVFVKFINCTNFNITILWINYAGGYTQYSLLRRRNYVNVTTYKSHPWIAIDVDTKNHMHLNKEYVYMPKTLKDIVREKFPNTDVKVDGNTNKRLIVKITFPLYSLKYIAILEIRSRLRLPEDVDRLELPKQLMHALKKSINERNSFKNISDQMSTI